MTAVVGQYALSPTALTTRRPMTGRYPTMVPGVIGVLVVGNHPRNRRQFAYEMSVKKTVLEAGNVGAPFGAFAHRFDRVEGVPK